MKTTKPIASVELAPLLEADERYQAEVDAYIDRNRGAINAAVKRAREDFQQGRVVREPVSEIVADHRRDRA